MKARLWPAWFETRYALLTMRVENRRWAKRSVPAIDRQRVGQWWARRKRAFAHASRFFLRLRGRMRRRHRHRKLLILLRQIHRPVARHRVHAQQRGFVN